jgi:hypothetical protein
MSTKNKEATKSQEPENGKEITTVNRVGGFLAEPGGTSFNAEEWEDRSLPPLIKAKDFKVGAVLIGKIEALTATEIPNTKKRGCLVTIVTARAGRCAIPATAVIIRSFVITGIDEGKPASPYIGREVMIKATGAAKTGKKGMRDFWGFDVKVKKA